MKRPLFNGNAPIGLRETPARVQRHEIVSRIKKKEKKETQGMANIHPSACGLQEQVPVLIFLCACVCVCMSSSQLSRSSGPDVGRCWWNASQKRKPSHVNISTIP